jgi:hypothetical protein
LNAFESVISILILSAYNILVKDPALPVINVPGRDNPSYLPAEVCEVRPGQPAGAKLSSLQTQQMIRFAVRRPIHNAQSIVTAGGRLLGFEPTNSTLVRTLCSTVRTS